VPRISHPWKVTLVVLVGVFVASLDLFIVNIAFPAIARNFRGSSLAGLSWVLNAYAILFAALLVPAGRWSDRAGRRRGFIGGLAVFVTASAACALAPSVAVLVAARAIQAVGAAFMLPTSLGLLLPEFPPERRAGVIGLWAAVGGVAAAAGPPIGGLLVQASWRWVFIVNVPIGLITLVAAVRVLSERREPAGPRPDVLGAGLIAAAIGALTFAIVKAPDWGWGSVRVVTLFVATALLLAGLVRRSQVHEAPVIEPELIRDRAIALANLGALLFFAGFAAMLLASVLFLTGVWHESVLRAGLEVAPGPATAALFAVPGGLLGNRFGQRVVGTAGTLLFAAGGLWWHAHLGATPRFASDYLPGMMIGGAGVGLVLPTLSAAATAPLPPARFATGSAILTMSRQVGSALGVAILVAIVGAPGRGPGPFDHAWLFMTCSALAAGATISMLGPVRLHRPVTSEVIAPTALEGQIGRAAG